MTAKVFKQASLSVQITLQHMIKLSACASSACGPCFNVWALARDASVWSGVRVDEPNLQQKSDPAAESLSLF